VTLARRARPRGRGQAPSLASLPLAARRRPTPPVLSCHRLPRPLSRWELEAYVVAVVQGKPTLEYAQV
jgi:hypothetical protein